VALRLCSAVLLCCAAVQEANGMIIVPVMSNPTGAWNGKKGYVQAVLKEDGVRVPRNTGMLNIHDN
jgi:hypothetical protein